MDFMVPIDLKKLVPPINYRDKILLSGSCFTEHIGNALEEYKFSVLQNPNGILFDPASVCKSLTSYLENRKYTADDLFGLNDVWHSWDHHSRFSNINKEEAIRIINASQQAAHDFLKQAGWIIITLGSSFKYYLTSQGSESSHSPGKGGEYGVANCHRAPAQWFRKQLLGIDEIISMLEDCSNRLTSFNPRLNILLTISPVRHVRDGVVENNRSKARLIEAVHHLTNADKKVHYFPAYELVMDVLRDYRFYDADLVHPNYMATEYVLENFMASCIDENSRQLMQEVRKIVIARKHKAVQPDTNAHREFLGAHFEKTKTLLEKYPFLDLQEELNYFKY
jgi:hypothetical protein